MAGPLRIEYEGACYHVMNRGNARRRVFHGDDDYRPFLDKLGRPVKTFRVSLRAFCLLPNHFHLYLATAGANLSRFMQSFLTAFPVRHTRRRRSWGHVLGRGSRSNTGRQVLLYLACRHCRGRYSLTDLAEPLAGITIGSLSRSRELMQQRLARDRALRGTVARLEQTLRAGSESHDAR